MQYISLLVHLVVKELIRRKQTWTESDENLYNFYFFIFQAKKEPNVQVIDREKTLQEKLVQV